jgi:hypothetical protein
MTSFIDPARTNGVRASSIRVRARAGVIASWVFGASFDLAEQPTWTR